MILTHFFLYPNLTFFSKSKGERVYFKVHFALHFVILTFFNIIYYLLTSRFIDF